jgi:D-proline reductase (dithiol) PrdB
MELTRLKNRTVAKIISKFPTVAGEYIDSYKPREFNDVPWTPVTKLLSDSKVAIVTTAGVHHKGQKPFNMNDPDGDPTFREIDIQRPLYDLMITHDYYDHADADRDINIVFPIERLREFETEGIIGRVADTHYSFMGHIDGRHIKTLINEYAPEVAQRVKADNVDVVLFTPG